VLAAYVTPCPGCLDPIRLGTGLYPYYGHCVTLPPECFCAMKKDLDSTRLWAMMSFTPEFMLLV
jgi:hypothetical protein